MACCKDHENAAETGLIVNAPRDALDDGVLRNEVITEFFISSYDENSGHRTYMGINYCPFCGMGISTELWLAEKK